MIIQRFFGAALLLIAALGYFYGLPTEGSITFIGTELGPEKIRGLSITLGIMGIFVLAMSFGGMARAKSPH